MPLVNVVCAWHPQYFGQPLIFDHQVELEAGLASHGICPECREKWMAEARASLAARKEGGKYERRA